jgi:hypothetical protein
MVNMPDDPARIVRFWHAVEMFSPQQLPKTGAKDNVADFRPGDPMPWEPAGKLDPPRSGKVRLAGQLASRAGWHPLAG